LRGAYRAAILVVLERFTARAREVVVLAGEEARNSGQGSIGTEHLLLGLLDQDDGIAVQRSTRSASPLTVSAKRSALGTLG
jgi:ATP-dependent Clp protease ATP-binding subunit ClpA